MSTEMEETLLLVVIRDTRQDVLLNGANTCKISGNIKGVRNPQSHHRPILLIWLCACTLIVLCLLIVTQEDGLQRGDHESLPDYQLSPTMTRRAIHIPVGRTPE